MRVINLPLEWIGEGALPKSLRILAWVHVVLGGLGLAIFALFMGTALAANDPAYEDDIAFFAGLFGLLSIAFFIPSFVGGLGLLKRWPWARSVIWVGSGLLVFLAPVGTALAGVNLWVLLKTREVSPDGGVAKFEAFVHRALRPLVLAMIAMAMLGVIIGLGYLFRDVIDPPKEQILTPMPSGVPDLSDRPKFEYVPPTLPHAPER